MRLKVLVQYSMFSMYILYALASIYSAKPTEAGMNCEELKGNFIYKVL